MRGSHTSNAENDGELKQVDSWIKSQLANLLINAS
jgi:hypothetical protein